MKINKVNRNLHSKVDNNYPQLFMAIVVIFIGIIARRVESDNLLLTAFVISAFYSITWNINGLLPFVLLLMASNRVLTIGSISLPTFVMIIGCIRIAFNGKMRIKLDNNFKICSILLIFESFFTYFNGSFQIFSSIKIIVMLYFIQSYVPKGNVNSIYIKMIEACSTGCIITSFLTMIINPSSLNENYRFSLTQTGGENVLGILCAIMALNLLYILLYKKIDNSLKYIVYITIIGIISLLTGSRSAILALLIGILGIFVVACIRHNFKQIILMVLFTSIIVVVLYFVLNRENIIATYADRFIYRMQKLSGTDISNGRFDIWAQYFSVFKHNPWILWFGGMNIAEFNIDMVAHNMIIEQVSMYGVIGSFILLAMYLITYRIIRVKSGSKTRIFSAGVIPLLTLLIVSMFSHTLLGLPQTMMLYTSAYGILEGRTS